MSGGNNTPRYFLKKFGTSFILEIRYKLYNATLSIQKSYARIHVMINIERDSRLLTKDTAIEKARRVATEEFDSFKNIQIDDHLINAPYWMNNNPSLEGTKHYLYEPRGGKLSVGEIIGKTIQVAKGESFSIKNASQRELKKFMFKHKIGVDCSGFVYQIEKSIFDTLGGNQFEKKLSGVEGDGSATKVNADFLTNPKNALEVDSFKSIIPGDMIRCKGGKHVIVILEKRGNTLRCAHSSDETEVSGVHEFNIQLENNNEDIFMQVWMEKTSAGGDYLSEIIRYSGKEDGVWRLKLINGLYDLSIINTKDVFSK